MHAFGNAGVGGGRMGVLAATGVGLGVGRDPISESSGSSPMYTLSYSSSMEEEGGVMKRFMLLQKPCPGHPKKNSVFYITNRDNRIFNLTSCFFALKKERRRRKKNLNSFFFIFDCFFIHSFLEDG